MFDDCCIPENSSWASRFWRDKLAGGTSKNLLFFLKRF